MKIPISIGNDDIPFNISERDAKILINQAKYLANHNQTTALDIIAYRLQLIISSN